MIESRYSCQARQDSCWEWWWVQGVQNKVPGLPWLSVVALSLQDGWSAQGVAGLPVPSLSALPPRSSPQRPTLQLLRTYRPPEWCHVASRYERRRII